MFEGEVGDFEKKFLPAYLYPKKLTITQQLPKNIHTLSVSQIKTCYMLRKYHALHMFQEKKFLANERVENIPTQNHPPPLKVNWSTPKFISSEQNKPRTKRFVEFLEWGDVQGMSKQRS